jgi:glycosyltransferase involved in cell wall biosynthesis
MTETIEPAVSVLMGAYNAERTIRAAIESILTQTFADFEFIIVNDGSTDSTSAVLGEYAEFDGRVRVIEQANQGLTRSLIAGASRARGRYIARQDADDVSMPRRLQKQVEVLDAQADSVLVTSWVEDLSPEGVCCAVHKKLQHAVKMPSGASISMVGIAAHGSVMMRRESFEHVGGYRACFYYAQDSDLWLRLSREGRFSVVPEVLYRRVIGMGSISSRYRQAQSRFCELAQESFRATHAGTSDEQMVAAADQVAVECRAQRRQPTSRYEDATSLLLLAAQLRYSEPKLARKYLWRAFCKCPVHPGTLKAMLLSHIPYLR